MEQDRNVAIGGRIDLDTTFWNESVLQIDFLKFKQLWNVVRGQMTDAKCPVKRWVTLGRV